MESALPWLTWLEPEDAKLAWTRAEGTPWKPTGWRFDIRMQGPMHIHLDSGDVAERPIAFAPYKMGSAFVRLAAHV
jgi:hypothetical protein